MSPGLNADRVADFYRDNTAWIRLSMITLNLFGFMLTPLLCVVVVQMKRMAHQNLAFAYCYLSAVVSGGTIFALANIFFLVAAFRPDRDADLVQLLNDLGWILLIAPVGMVVAQMAMLALAVYFDSDRAPVFPRWLAHLAVATAVAMTPSIFAALTTNGPFAWNGAVSFWLRNGAFAVYIVALFIVTRRAIRDQAFQEGITR
jgi:hypothetical protein